MAIKSRQDSLPAVADFEEKLLRASMRPDFTAAPGPLSTDRRANNDISELARVSLLEGDALFSYIAPLLYKEYSVGQVIMRLKDNNPQDLVDLNAVVAGRTGMDLKLITRLNRLQFRKYIQKTEGLGGKREASPDASQPQGHFVDPGRLKKQQTITANPNLPHGGVDQEYPQNRDPFDRPGTWTTRPPSPSQTEEYSRTVHIAPVQARYRSEPSRTQLPESEDSRSQSLSQSARPVREREYSPDNAMMQVTDRRNARYAEKRERDLASSPARKMRRTRRSQTRDRSPERKKRKKKKKKKKTRERSPYDSDMSE